MSRKVISGIQQVGIGVSNVAEAWDWYKKYLGFGAKIVDDEGVAEKMLPYTGGKPQPRHAYLAVNLRGGGGLEIWQPKGRELNYLDYTPEFGDLGLFACKIKSKDVKAARESFVKDGLNVVSEIVRGPRGLEHFFMRDPYGNLLDIEQDDYCLFDQKKLTGGNNGVIIGVSDMEKSIKFYSSIVEYDHVEYDATDVFSDLAGLPGGEYKLRRVMLSRSKPLEGPLSRVYGTSHIELVQRVMEPATSEVGSEAGVEAASKVASEAASEAGRAPRMLYEGRLWGDPGFIHLCFDIRNMEEIRKASEALGHSFVCDGGRDFKMGAANGHFTYIEDPDGALIEFVETFKIPVLKKLGIYLNLEKRDDTKSLPGIILQGFKFLESK